MSSLRIATVNGSCAFPHCFYPQILLKRHIFKISVESIQKEAERRIQRRLTDKELYSVKKGLESGLFFDYETVIDTVILEVENNNKNN